MDGALAATTNALGQKKQSRAQRMHRKVITLHAEVEQLETLAQTLLGHLEATIQPRMTDADRIRYRCMIQDIREELNKSEAVSDRRAA